MKLRTKLLPLTGLSLLGTTIVPLTLTGCAPKTATGNAFNVVNCYYPTIQRHEADYMRLNILNSVYTEQLISEPDTFTQDFLWSKSWIGAAFNQLSYWKQLLPISTKASANSDEIIIEGVPSDLYQYDREMISDLSIRQIHHLGEESQWNQSVLSFTYKFDSEVLSSIAEKPFLSDGATGYVNGHIAGEINFLNVPFILTERVIRFGGDQTPITFCSFEPDVYSMIHYPDVIGPWKIKYYISSTISGEIVYDLGSVRRIANDYVFNIEADIDHLQWPKYGISDLSEVTNMFSSSYYLEKIEIIL